MVSVGQEIRSRFTEQFWLGASHDAAVKRWAGAAVVRRLDGARGPASNMMHSHGCWQKASVVCHVDLSTGLIVFRMCQLVFSKVRDPTQPQKLYTIISVIFCWLHRSELQVTLTGVVQAQVSERHHQGRGITRKSMHGAKFKDWESGKLYSMSDKSTGFGVSSLGSKST